MLFQHKPKKFSNCKDELKPYIMLFKMFQADYNQLSRNEEIPSGRCSICDKGQSKQWGFDGGINSRSSLQIPVCNTCNKKLSLFTVAEIRDLSV